MIPTASISVLNVESVARQARRGSLLSLFGLLVMLGALAFTAQRVTANQTTIAEQQRKMAMQRQLITRNDSLINRLLPAALRAYGWRGDSLARVLTSDSLLVRQSIRALEEIPSLRERLAAPTAASAGSPAVLQYFAKDTTRDLNNWLFVQSLRDMGYRIKIRNPSNDLPSNALWYGERVNIDHVRLITLTMLRAGYRLQQVARFPESGSDRSSAVQIGANWNLRNAPLLTVDSILRATAFPVDATPGGLIPSGGSR